MAYANVVTPTGDVILVPSTPQPPSSAPPQPYVSPTQQLINDLRARLAAIETHYLNPEAYDMTLYENNIPEARDADEVDSGRIQPTLMYAYDAAATDASKRLVPVTPGMLTGTGPDTASARETTLTQVRDRLNGTLDTRATVTAPTSSSSAIAAGSSTGAGVNLGGLSITRIILGAAWTAADLTFETSLDGTTWFPLYDAFGNLIQYRASAGRAVTVPVGDLLRMNHIRPRSGVPGAYVNQVAATSVTFVTAVF